MRFAAICSIVASLVVTGASAAPQDTKKAAKAPAAKGAGHTVTITANDTMKYDVVTIDAKPGEMLHIVLKNAGTMPKIAMAHNVVVLKLGTDEKAFATAGMTFRDNDFVAPANKEQVIAASPMAGPGETVEVMVKIPAKAGKYPYVCTFPGHAAAGMGGAINVK